MEQLTGRQCLYLNLESPRAPMHASSLMIYDPSTAPSGRVHFADIQRFFADRLHRSAIFRRRIVSMPLSIARPYWVDDAAPDLGFHLRHIALPRPGDWSQLCAQVARLHAQPLDRTRPLWQCYVIDGLDRIPGLPPGCFALCLKVHFAAQGETPSTPLFAALHELSPDSRASPARHPPRFDRSPTFADLVSRGAMDTLRRPLAWWRQAAAGAAPLIAAGARGTHALATRIGRRGGETHHPVAPEAPNTRFNAAVSPDRIVDAVEFGLRDIERMRDRVHGATVNDVALAIIGEGLRGYLDGRGEPPAASLVAEAPLARGADARIAGGRSFADSAIVSLHTDIADAAARLSRIAAETRRRKTLAHHATPRRLAIQAVEFVPTLALGAAGELAHRVRLGSPAAPCANTTVATVHGPDVPLYMAGATLVGHHAFTAVQDQAGIAHTVCLHSGVLSIGVAGCRAMLPDPRRYARCLRAAFVAMGAALGVPVAAATPQRRARGARASRAAIRRDAERAARPQRARDARRARAVRSGCGGLRPGRPRSAACAPAHRRTRAGSRRRRPRRRAPASPSRSPGRPSSARRP